MACDLRLPTIIYGPAIDRDRLVREVLSDDRRNQLFAILERAVIIRAIGCPRLALCGRPYRCASCRVRERPGRRLLQYRWTQRMDLRLQEVIERIGQGHPRLVSGDPRLLLNHPEFWHDIARTGAPLKNEGIAVCSIDRDRLRYSDR